MQFHRVTLRAAASRLAAARRFYVDDLGVPADDPQTFRLGATVVGFEPAEDGEPFHHFAVRVPRNRFAAARDWIAGRAELLPGGGSGQTTFDFDFWNAHACYVHDPCGNIVELIAHHELPEESPGDGPFRADELIGLCEVGLVGPDTRAMAAGLQSLGIELWDGTLDEPGRLAFMGGRDGVLILASTGRGWMPTGRPAEAWPVEAVVAGARDAEAALAGTAHRIRTVASSRP